MGVAKLQQIEFSFLPMPDRSAPHSGYETEWQVAAEALCREIGLPLKQLVEVRLLQGPILRGKLRLDSDQLWPKGDQAPLVFRIGETTFGRAEIESVVRLEGLTETVVDEGNPVRETL